MCGASSAQEQLQQEEMASLKDYDAKMQEQYQNQKALYARVNSVLQPIFEKGPGQQGMSDAERADLNAQAVDGTARNYKNAAQAVNENLAAQGGGNLPITTGGQEQIRAELASSAAGVESRQQSDIIEKDYALGRENFLNAEQGEMAIAAGENPLGYMNATVSQENAANDEANAIAAEDNSWVNAALGAAGTIGAAAVGKIK